jgi:hypothetical protein
VHAEHASKKHSPPNHLNMLKRLKSLSLNLLSKVYPITRAQNGGPTVVAGTATSTTTYLKKPIAAIG